MNRSDPGGFFDLRRGPSECRRSANASLLLVEVFINLSDLEEKKNSSEFFDLLHPVRMKQRKFGKTSSCRISKEMRHQKNASAFFDMREEVPLITT
jgi:hypothetical protein